MATGMPGDRRPRAGWKSLKSRLWLKCLGRDRDVRTGKIYGPASSLPGGAPSESMQALDEATLALGRATKTPGADDGRQDARLARRRGRRQVLVEEKGLGTRASPVRQGGEPGDLLAARQGDP